MMTGEEFDLEALIEAPFRSDEQQRSKSDLKRSSELVGRRDQSRSKDRPHYRHDDYHSGSHNSHSGHRRRGRSHSRSRSRSPVGKKGSYHYSYDGDNNNSNSHSDRHNSVKTLHYQDRQRHRDIPPTSTSSIESLAKDNNGGEQPEEVIGEAQRDRRTVFCRQLAQRLEAHQLKEFCEQAGRVRDVRIVYDRISRRSKGVAYVEFYEEESVPAAVALTGQKLFGIPIKIELTETEKNRLAEEAAAILRQELLNKRPPLVLLSISNLNSIIGEADLRKIFEPFGEICNVHIDRVDPSVRVSTTAKIHFKEATQARQAAEKMHNFELAGRALRVKAQEVDADSYIASRTSSLGTTGSTEETDLLLETDLTEMLLRSTRETTSLKSLAHPSRPSPCLLLQHLYDPTTETEPEWDQEIAREVREECARFGRVEHLHVPRTNDGDVFARFASVDSAQAAATSLTGRWFGGRQIVALFLPVTDYLRKFPNSN